MRLGQVIGRVTLSRQDPSYKAGRFVVVLPYVPPVGQSRCPSKNPEKLINGNSLVVYDNLGASTGDVIAYSESGEAAAAFKDPTPVDAFNCALLDHTFWNPPKKL